MWATTPLVGYLFVGAHSVIALLLGDQWGESAAIFRIFAVVAPVFPLFRLNGLLFQSRGRTDRLLKLELFRSPILVGGFVVGLPFGIKGVALSYNLVLLAILPWVFRFTFSGTHLTLPRLVRAVVNPSSLCLAAVLCSLLVLHLVSPAGDLARLAVVALAFVAVYLLGALVPPVRREILSLRDLLRELRPSKGTR